MSGRTAATACAIIWAASIALWGTGFAFADGVKQIDEIENVEVVTPVAVPETAQQGLSLAKLFGRLHPAAVHLPLGAVVVLLFVEFLALGLGWPGAERCGLWILVLIALSAIPAAATGLLRANELNAASGIDNPLISLHRNVMLALFAAIFAALALRWTKRASLTRGVRAAYFALLVLAMGLAAYGGHLGGELVFGEDFLL